MLLDIDMFGYMLSGPCDGQKCKVQSANISNGIITLVYKHRTHARAVSHAPTFAHAARRSDLNLKLNLNHWLRESNINSLYLSHTYTSTAYLWPIHR